MSSVRAGIRVLAKLRVFWRAQWKWVIPTVVAIIAVSVPTLEYFSKRQQGKEERLAQAEAIYYEVLDLIGARPGDSKLTVYFDNKLPKDLQAQRKTLEEARRRIEKFTILQPDDPRGLFLTFMYHVASNNSDGAERTFKKLQERENEISDVGYHVVMGSIYAFRFERYDVAKSHFERAIGLQPSDPEAHAMYGLILHTDNQNDLSILMLNKAIELNPRNPRYRVGLGHVLFESGKTELSLDVLKKAINLGLAYSETYIVLGTFHADLGKHKEAIQAYEKGIELSPRQGIPYVNLSLSLRKLGETRKAKEALTKARQVWDYPMAFEDYMKEMGKHPHRGFW